MNYLSIAIPSFILGAVFAVMFISYMGKRIKSKQDGGVYAEYQDGK